MNKYIISVRNTANGKYENVEVSEEVYRAYMRTGWNIKDNDESFFKHQIQFSALLGNINDAAENFKEFINAVEDVAEITEKNLISEALKKVLKQLDQDERELIFLIFNQNKTEVECAEKYGISQQFINKKKKRILDASICRELNESKVIKNDKETKWFLASIQFLINEMYIGDSLWQKNYNTSMPYKKVRNKGELEKYYINNTHEAIITSKAIRYIFKLYLDGMSINQISYNGITFDWNKNMVKRILENEKYLGKDGYPALIDSETFYRANARKKIKATSVNEISEELKIIRSLTYCTECGHRLSRIGGNTQTDKWDCRNIECSRFNYRLTDNMIKDILLHI